MKYLSSYLLLGLLIGVAIGFLKPSSEPLRGPAMIIDKFTFGDPLSAANISVIQFRYNSRTGPEVLPERRSEILDTILDDYVILMTAQNLIVDRNSLFYVNTGLGENLLTRQALNYAESDYDQLQSFLRAHSEALWDPEYCEKQCLGDSLFKKLEPLIVSRLVADGTATKKPLASTTSSKKMLSFPILKGPPGANRSSRAKIKGQALPCLDTFTDTEAAGFCSFLHNLMTKDIADLVEEKGDAYSPSETYRLTPSLRFEDCLVESEVFVRNKKLISNFTTIGKQAISKAAYASVAPLVPMSGDDNLKSDGQAIKAIDGPRDVRQPLLNFLISGGDFCTAKIKNWKKPPVHLELDTHPELRGAAFNTLIDTVVEWPSGAQKPVSPVSDADTLQ